MSINDLSCEVYKVKVVRRLPDRLNGSESNTLRWHTLRRSGEIFYVPLTLNIELFDCNGQLRLTEAQHLKFNDGI